MTEFEVKAQLEESRKNIKSFDDLVAFLRKVKDECNTSYGVAPRAIAQAALATAWYLASDFGITGFQAGFVMWDFIKDWILSDNKCGAKLVDYDNMLYPQYQDRFEKTIDKETFEALQIEANKRILEALSDDGAYYYVHPNVFNHWQSIVDGKVPFGYSIEEKEE